MDQKQLRALENKCIQDQPAECVAACPLHVDARSFVGLAGRGQWDEAWKILRKTMPFPGILGRLCDAPCRNKCLRGRAGDPIRIDALERACVSRKAPMHHVLPLPSRDRRVAVVGSGLSSLTAAWDLARKGYTITIFEPGPELGGPLLNLDEKILPAGVVQGETAVLGKLGVTVKTDAAVDQADFPESLLGDYDAVYLGLDAVDGSAWSLARNQQGGIEVQPLAQTTSREGILAGGLPGPEGALSPVFQAAEGRWAATSIDRFVQKVSPTAGREKDGPYQTRLFTSLEGVEPRPAAPMADPEQGYTEAEALAEAARCLQCQCLECVKVCPYLEHYGSYPKKYAREIYNNESIVLGSRQANKLINSCSLCGLCEQVCPEGFAMQDLCLEVRQGMVRRGKMPPSAHEFALLDMQFSNSEHFAVARHEPGRTSSAQAFFPGCQLSASSPGQVRSVYEYLRQNLPDGVGMILGCCAAPAAWAGQEESCQGELAKVKESWAALGKPRLILACSTCHKMFRDFWPEADIVSLWQVLADLDLPIRDRAGLGGSPLAVLDPCTTRTTPDIQDAARAVLDRLGVATEELVLGRDRTECCGFGGLMQNANPEVARAVVRKRALESPVDYLAYCAMCRDNLAAADKRVLHLLDLVFPTGDTDPASRKRPGWSERQANRVRLKDSLLKELWGERTREMEEYEKTRLIIDPEVRHILEDRRILDDDLKKVIAHAEETADRLVHPETGRIRAAYKPVNVTFWVEYSTAEDGFVVHNAYSHRMEVVGGGRL